MDLRTFSIFSQLNDEELETVRGAVRLRHFARREVVCRKEDVPDGLYLLLSGRLQVIDIGEDGREVGLNLLRPGAFFGELSVIDGLPRSAHIIAQEAATVGVVPQQAARDLFYRTPGTAEAMLRHVTALVRNLSSYRVLLAIPNAPQRVHALLQQLSQPMPGGMVAIQNLPKRQEMAIMVNTSRETVSRAIAQLIGLGVVEKDFRRLIVRDPAALARMAAQATPLPPPSVAREALAKSPDKAASADPSANRR